MLYLQKEIQIKKEVVDIYAAPRFTQEMDGDNIDEFLESQADAPPPPPSSSSSAAAAATARNTTRTSKTKEKESKVDTSEPVRPATLKKQWYFHISMFMLHI
jgi:ribosomal protein L12E/L44/L45/RPP1/RPP2